ncbi:hypothetical protein [Streptomyces sp. NPDC059009]|uniref:hypothetical protein n=1 Tax=Streptomyces sp. NPDC059009 TaxID=3346694 RepID=UPI00368F5F47
MLSLLIPFGLLAAVAMLLIVVLLRRGNRRTENADGLLIEQQRRAQARTDRTTYGAGAVRHSTTPFGDRLRP